MLQEFVELYRASPRVDVMKSGDNPERAAFIQKKGLPVAITSVKTFLDKVPHVEAYYPFFQAAPIFWMVPCDSPSGQIYGFVLRSYRGKEYRIVFQKDVIQMLFGFGAFVGFKKGFPIILTEGSKDAIFLQTIYRFSLALLSTSLSREVITFLKSLTNRVVVATDNNEAGRRRSKEIGEALSKEGINNLQLCPALNDWGEYFMDTSKQPVAKEQIKTILGRFK